MTDAVIRYADRAKGAGQKRIMALAEPILRKDLTRYDMAIRSWAQGDRKAAAVFRKAMRKRLGYVSSLFRDAGYPAGEATARGHLLAIYLMSEGAIHIGESVRTRLRLLRRQVRALTAPE